MIVTALLGFLLLIPVGYTDIQRMRAIDFIRETTMAPIDSDEYFETEESDEEANGDKSEDGEDINKSE